MDPSTTMSSFDLLLGQVEAVGIAHSEARRSTACQDALQWHEHVCHERIRENALQTDHDHES